MSGVYILTRSIQLCFCNAKYMAGVEFEKIKLYIVQVQSGIKYDVDDADLQQVRRRIYFAKLILR